QLLQAARDLDAPSLVPEVPANLADDRGSRVACELAPARRVVAIDRVDEADHGHLGEVVNRLATVPEPAGQTRRERDVVLDDLIAQPRPYGRIPGRRGGREQCGDRDVLASGPALWHPGRVGLELRALRRPVLKENRLWLVVRPQALVHAGYLQHLERHATGPNGTQRAAACARTLGDADEKPNGPCVEQPDVVQVDNEMVPPLGQTVVQHGAQAWIRG